jgi:hypothetical protein
LICGGSRLGYINSRYEYLNIAMYTHATGTLDNMDNMYITGGAYTYRAYTYRTYTYRTYTYRRPRLPLLPIEGR